MMRQLTLALLFITGYVSAQDKMPYKIFDKNGKAVSYQTMLSTASDSEIVLFGEHHDNSIIHWLELSLAKDLSKTKKLVMGAEMIESDNQAALNSYLKGEINQKQFDTIARLWTNYKTDYKPLVDFAKSMQIPFVATNVPRRYASMVYKGGFEALDNLSVEEKSWIAPMPFAYDATLPGYVKMIAEMGGHGGDNLPKAQAIKDATMAHFIVKNKKDNSIFLHFNGTYHSDDFEGIYWYLKNSDPSLKVMTIATVVDQNLTLHKESYNKADFIIVTPEDITKTY